MTNSRRYMYLHNNENEWLSEPPEDTSMQEEWDEAWGLLKKDCAHQIEFTEDIYTNSDYNGVPDWVDVHIRDDYILEMKMARGIVKAINGAQSIVFHLGTDCDVEKGWGGIGHSEIAITEGGAYITIQAKHSSEEIEVNITEQFNQAIGETA